MENAGVPPCGRDTVTRYLVRRGARTPYMCTLGLGSLTTHREMWTDKLSTSLAIAAVGGRTGGGRPH